MADLQLNSLLRKTEAGETAIKVRDATLSPKSRMILIMLDGKKPASEMLKLRPDPQEVMELLGELVDRGYARVINPVAAQAQTSPTAATLGADVVAGPSPASSAAPASAMPLNLISDATALKLAIRRATRFLEDNLGPTSEGMCIQLEKCASGPQFTAKVLEIRRAVASVKSEKKADEFVTIALVA